jgi:hypothetical protein
MSVTKMSVTKMSVTKMSVTKMSVTKMSETKVPGQKVTGTKMFVIQMSAKMPETKICKMNGLALKCPTLKYQTLEIFKYNSPFGMKPHKSIIFFLFSFKQTWIHLAKLFDHDLR